MVSGTSGAPIAWRANVGVPSMSASPVALVTSDSVCNVAAHALQAHIDSSAPPVASWVYTLGPTRTVAFDKHRHSRHS